jgi:putative PEP-CTERM system histidine kinase
MHDLKNAVAQLRLVVSNATRHKRNPEFVDDAVLTIGNAVTRIDRLIGQLRFGVREAATQDVRIEQMLNGAIARCAVRRPVPTIEGPVPDVVVEADPERLVSVMEHALRNAQDATSESGHVSVSCDLFADRVAIVISDNGTGMDAEFIRERLFTPFDTTKGASGMGIGAHQVREYARSLGGNVQVQSTPGSGTRFVIILPTVDQETKHG